MKTKNNIQKTAIKLSVVIVSFVLISLTVNAQDLHEDFLTNNSFKVLAFAKVENPKANKTIASDKNLSISKYSDFLEESIEENLEVETWMINENLFAVTIDFEVEAENQLELENWMLDDTLFNNTSLLINEFEEKLTIENWMLDYKLWNF